MALKPEVEGIFEDVPRITRVATNMGEFVVAPEKPSNMSPEERDERRMRIILLVAVHMVLAVRCDPASGSVLQAQQSERRERQLEPARCFETAVGEQAVVSHRDRLSKEVDANNPRDDTRPGEKVREHREHSEQVHQNHRHDVAQKELGWHRR